MLYFSAKQCTLGALLHKEGSKNLVLLADFFLLSELVVCCVLTRHLVIMNYCFNNASLTLPKYSLHSQTSWQTNLLFSVSSAFGRTHSVVGGWG